MHTIPLALATLSTTAAAINTDFNPFSLIILDLPTDQHPCNSGQVIKVPPCLGVKNTISIIDRQP